MPWAGRDRRFESAQIPDACAPPLAASNEAGAVSNHLAPGSDSAHQAQGGGTASWFFLITRSCRRLEVLGGELPARPRQGRPGLGPQAEEPEPAQLHWRSRSGLWPAG